ncbi:MAG: phosphoglucosamine mutase [Bacteroidales bacterium]|nr:phosphoglucosamine mutase [Bacteroidales bacterium]NPV37081.1 phosphoglucosamine mutase [Bacteroidales bacterium]
MTLIRSISGIRGTIGGAPGDGLTPMDAVKYTAAFCWFIQEKSGNRNPHIVLGRDARISGPALSDLVRSTLQFLGSRVTDIGLTTTPTTEMAVIALNADGGIILTASHNPREWNALKLLNAKGGFLSAEDGAQVLSIAEKESYRFAAIDNIGKCETRTDMLEYHIQKILELKLVDKEAITRRKFRVVVDAVNSSGGIAIPQLLKALGVNDIICLNCEPTGHFAHNPEPLPQHLTEISELIRSQGADLGIVVDPDVDRLALVCEDGNMFGEEYTLVAVADYVLRHKGGPTVSNLSSTRALRVITEKAGYIYQSAAVGEVNVVEKMKEIQAVVGGEGNGGVIFPELHYGRDALVGIALFLSHLAQSGLKTSELRKTYPNYSISKNKIDLKPGTDINPLFEEMTRRYKHLPHSTIDGLKIEFDDEWVHLRPSNTEPIIRVYAESTTEDKAQALASKIIDEIYSLTRNH